MYIIAGNVRPSAHVTDQDLELALQADHATPSEMHSRTEVLAVSVEIAELYRADGDEVPEHLLREITEYRSLQQRLTKPHRRAEHRTERRQTRTVLRAVQSVATAAGEVAA